MPKNQNNDFYNYQNNTHHETPANSRGLLLLQLFDKYIQPDSQKNLTAEDIIEAQFDACMAALQLDEVHKNWIKQIANEALVAGRDDVTIHEEIPTTSETTADPAPQAGNEENVSPIPLKSTTHRVGVKKTIAVLYLAIQDDSPWKAEYTQEHRLQRLAELIREVYDDKTRCHTGVRNELVNVLRGYGDIQLLTSDENFILQIAHQFLYEKLIGQSQWQTHFNAFLWPWIKEHEMPEIIQPLIDDRFFRDLKNQIRAEFLKRGLKVCEKKLKDACQKDKFIEQQCSLISDKFFILLADWMNVYYSDDGVRRKKWPEKLYDFIDAIFTWLDKDFNIDNEQHKICFLLIRRLCDAIRKINQLEISHDVRELFSVDLISTLLSFAHGEAIQQLTQDNDKTLLEINLDTFEIRYPAVYAKLYYSRIENFFAEWFFDDRMVTQAKAYCLLRLSDPEFQKAVIFSDDMIQQIFNQHESDNTQDLVISLDVYHLNRFLLQAIIKPRKEWSELFTTLLPNVILFIENQFDQPNNQRTLQLKRDSYPPRLLTVLNNLIKDDELSRCEEPSPAEILWRSITSSWPMYYDEFQRFIEKLPIEKRISLILVFKDQLDSIINSHRKLKIVLNLLPPSDHSVIFSHLKNLHIIIENFFGLLEDLTAENRSILIFQLDKKYVENKMRYFDGMLAVMKTLPEEDCLTFCERFRDLLSSLTLTINQLEAILRRIPLEKRALMLSLVGENHYLPLLQTPENFVILYDCLPVDSQKILFNHFEHSKQCEILDYLRMLPSTLALIKPALEISNAKIHGDINSKLFNEFHDQYQLLRSNLFKKDIEQFFEEWSCNGSEIDIHAAQWILNCYHPIFRRTVLLSETFLQEIKTCSDITDSPYLTNRFLLHALIVSPQDWGKSFTDLLKKLIKEEIFCDKYARYFKATITDRISCVETNRNIEAPFFYTVLSGKKFEFNRYGGNPELFSECIAAIPEEYHVTFLEGLLPVLVDILKYAKGEVTALLNLFKKTSGLAQLIVINHYKNRFPGLDWAFHELIDLIKSTKPSNHQALIDSISISIIKQSINFNLVNRLPAFIKALNSDWSIFLTFIADWPEIYSSIDSLIYFLEHFNAENRITLIEKIGIYKIESLMEERINNLFTLFRILPDEASLSYFSNTFSNIISMIKLDLLVFYLNNFKHPQFHSKIPYQHVANV